MSALQISRDQPQNSRAEPSLLDVAHLLLKYRRRMVALPLSLVLLTGAVALVLPRYYSATAAFTPQAPEGNLGRLSGLAAQFGLAVPGVNPNVSPDFYAQLLTMRPLLAAVVDTPFTFAGDTGKITATLVQLLRPSGSTDARRREKAIESLARKIEVGKQAKTGIVTVTVRTRWAELSPLVAQRLLELVNDFNLKSRQSQAGAERRFVEDRLKQARGELKDAEDATMAFLTKNREFRNAPALQFEYDRLTREMGIRQEVVRSLVQSYENSKIEEVRNTSVITVVEAPTAPAFPDSRHLLLKLILALVLGLILATGFSLAEEMVAISRSTDPEEFRRVSDLARAAVSELRWRRSPP